MRIIHCRRIISTLLLLSLLLTESIPILANVSRDNTHNGNSKIIKNKDTATVTRGINQWVECLTSGNVTGIFSANNNNQNIDYKIQKSMIEDKIKNYNFEGDVFESYCNKDPLRNMSYLNKEKSYLISHDIISREKGFYEKGGLLYVEQAQKDNEIMSKTDLYMGLYKSVFGVIPSRAIVLKTKATRSNKRVHYIERYVLSNNDVINATFNKDNFIYFSPNVYELYLTELLNKGLINIRDIKDSNFKEEYLLLQRGGKKPSWYKNLPPTEDNALGRSFSMNDGRYMLVQNNKEYLNDENLTTLDALHMIEEFMRLTEKDMSKLEADIVLYKYGINYLEKLSEYDRNTIVFLIAKGILNYENPDEFINFYSDFTYDLAYKLLYRIANKDARYDFSKIQLTDSESFWQSKGFASDNVEIYEEQSIPFMKVFDEDSSYIDFHNDDKNEDTMPDYDDILASVFNPLIVYAETKTSKVNIEYLLEDGYSYSYDGKELTANSTPNDIKDLAENVEVKKYNNIKMLLVKFSVDAKDKDTALAMVESKLNVDLEGKTGSKIIGVTKVKSENGETLSLISSESLMKAVSEITVVNNNTLLNTKTGTLGMLFPEQGYALIGNKIVKSDVIMMKGKDDIVYYNLDVICSLMSNGFIMQINGSKSLVSQTLKTEKISKVFSENNTLLEKNYTAEFSGAFKESNDNGTISKVKSGLMYNLDTLTNGMSVLTRTFRKKVKLENKKTKDSDISVIVRWDFIVPEAAGKLADYINKNEGTLNSNLTYEEANKIVSTRPKNKKLRAWWDLNIGMSNALANFMYGTKSIKYVENGYLVPSVTVLSSAGGERTAKTSQTDGNVITEPGSLSDSQLNNLFKDLSVPLSYAKKYLNGSSTESWWTYYYDSTYKKGSIAKSLINKASFKVLSPDEILYKDGSEYNVDGYSYGAGNYVVLNNGTIYKSCNDGIVYKDGNDLRVYTNTENNRFEPSSGVTKFTIGSGANKITFKYLGTKKKGKNTYYKLLVYNKKGSLFKCKFKGNRSQIADPKYYKNTNGVSAIDFEKSLYQKFDSSMPNSLSIQDRFSLEKTYNKYANDNYYVDFKNSNSSNYMQLFYYKDNKFVKKSENDFIQNANTTKLNVSITIYLDQSQYYFAKDANANIKLNKGATLGVLNTSLYFSGLNNIVRDKILCDMNDVKSINSLKDSQHVYIGGLDFVKKGKELIAYNVKDSKKILPTFLESFAKNRKTNQASCLMKVIGLQTITAGARQLSLQSFITTIDIGKQSSNKQINCLYKQDKAYFFRKNKNASKATKATSAIYPDNLNLKITVSDALLCIPLDTDGRYYSMLYSSNEYGNSSISQLPFYTESSYLEEDSKFSFNLKTTSYQLSKFVREIHQEILDDYNKAFQGDIISLGKMICVAVLSYLIVATWLSYLMLRYDVGLRIFEAISMPVANGNRRGIDLIKLFTLGVFDLNDNPNLSRVMVMDFIFVFIIYFIIFIL